MQILDPHRARDIARSQLRAQGFGQRSAGPENALRMQRAWQPGPGGSRRGFPSLVSANSAVVIPRVEFDEALDPSIVGAEPKHPSNRGRDEQITFDVAQAPDEDLEPAIGLDEIRTVRREKAVGGRLVDGFRGRLIIAIEHDQP